MIEVQVLLSSYNGEKYIREQLDSILIQKNVKVELLIRDDGSTDKTIEILQEYERKWDNVQVIYGKNIGVIESFFTLIEQVSRDKEYIAFSDQDDKWLPEKLIKAVQKIRKQQTKKTVSTKQLVNDNKLQPIVYCSAKQLVNATLQPLPMGISYKTVKTEFGNALVENMCTGCTCVINRELLQLLKERKPTFTIMHDFWIYLIGTCFGIVIYDKNSYILYRQHDNNVLGTASSLLENYKRRIKNFRKNRGKLTKQAEELVKIYSELMPEENKSLIEQFIKSKKKISLRRKIVVEGKIFRQRMSDDWIMKLFLLLGWL